MLLCDCKIFTIDERPYVYVTVALEPVCIDFIGETNCDDICNAKGEETKTSKLRPRVGQISLEKKDPARYVCFVLTRERMLAPKAMLFQVRVQVPGALLVDRSNSRISGV
jgi:hypothetical protein